MGVGPRKHLAGLGGIDEGVDGDGAIFVVERRDGDGWHEIERTASRSAAEDALDQLAGQLGIDLGDLRVRELD
jgi:hypothetical protein